MLLYSSKLCVIVIECGGMLFAFTLKSIKTFLFVGNKLTFFGLAADFSAAPYGS